MLAGLWGATLGLLHWRGDMWFLDRVEGTMVDLRNILRGATKPPANIAIVAIDDRIAQDQGYPVPRSTLSHLITEIARAGPAAIAVDMLLVDPGEPADDAMLATALGESPVVLAAAAVFAGGKQWVAPQSYGPLSRVPNAERFLMPLPTFADVATLGVVNIATDQSGTPRFAPLLFQAGRASRAFASAARCCLGRKGSAGI